MLNRFHQYIEENSLASHNLKILLAVSGGIDSTVMLHLFTELGKHKCAIAHCNFQLRGSESDKDQEFVKAIAEQNSLEFFTANFETHEYATKKRMSIQMAARELRYDWFSKLAKEYQFDRIALAHNQDDAVETFILNLIRGTGTKGLTGIKPLTGITIRPLLFASRTEIESYVKKYEINFRKDSSNAEIKYKRNLIRHKILPLLRELNPSIRETISQEMEIFAATWNIYQREIESLKKVCFTINSDRYLINISKLTELDISPPLLFDMLSEFEFSYSVVKDIVNCLHAESGRKFYSANYLLLKDRDYLIIEKIDESSAEEIYKIEESMVELNFPLNLTINKFPKNDDFFFPKSNTIASLDLDKLNFPLSLRHWKDGDFFYPLGMGGKKKLSDFFNDEKIDLFGKKRIWLLISGNDIVWIVGHRIDDRFKIVPKTKNILMLEIKN